MTARDAFVSVDGLSFHYRDWGGEGRPMLLLHGLASNCHIWDAAAPLLRERASVIALCQRGHGESDKPDDGYEFESVVRDAVGITEALGLEKPVVVGHSWGASVALEAAARHPEWPAALILVDGGFAEMSSRMTWEEAEKSLAPPDLTHFTPAELLERAKSWYADHGWNEHVQATLLGSFDVAADGHIRPHLTRERHMRILRTIWEQRASALFESVSCPVLIAPTRRATTGPEADWIRSKEESVGRALALFPNARLRWMEDAIHDVPLQRPRELADVILEFVESIES